MNQPTIDPNEFLMTKEYRRFEEFCNACFREKYIGLCYGAPGVGKTRSARHYAKSDGFDHFSGTNLSETEKIETAGQLISCRAVVYTACVTNTPKRVEGDLKNERYHLLTNLYQARQLLEKNDSDIHDDHSMLVIIDEADRLKMNVLEQVRDMYDRNDDWGVVLIGMPGLERRLARYPQLYSRVGFAHEYRPIGQDEMFFILQHHWAILGLELNKSSFPDSEAVAAVARITNGNFRLVHRLFSQINRIMMVNALTNINNVSHDAAYHHQHHRAFHRSHWEHGV
jgi:hypothetical protein